jgi:hypothetical protein
MSDGSGSYDGTENYGQAHPTIIERDSRPTTTTQVGFPTDLDHASTYDKGMSGESYASDKSGTDEQANVQIDFLGRQDRRLSILVEGELCDGLSAVEMDALPSLLQK